MPAHSVAFFLVYDMKQERAALAREKGLLEASRREFEAERAEYRRGAQREQEEWSVRRQGEERALREAVCTCVYLFLCVYVSSGAVNAYHATP